MLVFGGVIHVQKSNRFNTQIECTWMPPSKSKQANHKLCTPGPTEGSRRTAKRASGHGQSARSSFQCPACPQMVNWSPKERGQEKKAKMAHIFQELMKALYTHCLVWPPDRGPWPIWSAATSESNQLIQSNQSNQSKSTHTCATLKKKNAFHWILVVFFGGDPYNRAL